MGIFASSLRLRPISSLAAASLAIVVVNASACSASSSAPAPAATDAGGDAASGDATGGAGACMVLATSYTQSCLEDTDCIPAVTGDFCTSSCWCPNASINVSSQGHYQMDVAAVTAHLTEKTCNCPLAPTPCCRGGQCHADAQCLADASADDAKGD